MPITATTEVTACSDCVMAAVNDEWPDRDAEHRELLALQAGNDAPWLWGRVITRQPDPLANLEPGDRLVTNDAEGEDGYHFSWSPCQTCGTSLGGDRYDCTVFTEN